MSLFVYKLSGPVLQIQDEPTVISTDENSQEVSLSYDVLKQLKQEQWKDCTLNKKISLLQKVCDYESTKLGIPTVVLKATKLDDFVLGQYDPGKTFIWVGEPHVDGKRVGVAQFANNDGLTVEDWIRWLTEAPKSDLTQDFALIQLTDFRYN